MFFICCMICSIFLFVLESFCTGPMSNTLFSIVLPKLRGFQEIFGSHSRHSKTNNWSHQIVDYSFCCNHRIWDWGCQKKRGDGGCRGCSGAQWWWRMQEVLCTQWGSSMQGTPWYMRCTSPVYCEQVGKVTPVSKARAAQKNSQWFWGDGHSRQRGHHKQSHSGWEFTLRVRCWWLGRKWPGRTCAGEGICPKMPEQIADLYLEDDRASWIPV